MEVTSYSSARSHLAATMEQVCDDRLPVILARQNARSVVLMSLEDCEACEETAYLLRSPANAVRLFESLAQAAKGKVRNRKLLR